MGTDIASTQPSSEFEKISGDTDNPEGLTVVESLCVACGENGETKFLFVQIPFYREVIISSFYCPYCHYTNNEIQSAGVIQEMGQTLTLKVVKARDMVRQVIRTDNAKVTIPELDFEIPAGSQKGSFTTVEGILQRAVQGLEQEQPVRRALNPEVADQIDAFIDRLKALMTPVSDVTTPFTMIIEDPSGNSFIENPSAPRLDPNLTQKHWKRSLDQDKNLGIRADDDIEETEPEDIQLPETTDNLDLRNEVVTFQTNCSQCGAPNDTNMKMVKIPFFKEVIIMASVCEKCGYKTNEVKSGSGFSDTGKKITLKVKNTIDLSRDVLKSETCSIEIPELDLETGAMAVCGKFTTVEGLLTDLKTMMIESNPFVGGDSETSDKLIKVGQRIDGMLKLEEEFTLILDDMNNNSYILSLCAPDPDPQITEFEYERTFDQNEELGLNDMNTENYATGDIDQAR